LKRAPVAALAAAGDLPDVNVWLALAIAEHPHHAAALAYWQQSAAPSLWFCRVTMLGLVRLLTQPRLMGSAALSAPAALAAYDQFAALPEVALRAEPASCEAEMRRIVQADLPARLLTDAYLAAFAMAADLRLVTFDRDFERFDGLKSLRLAVLAN
jgi:toxin-antitoxin system PIN domain toxin